MAIKINSIKIITEFVDPESGEVFTEERVLGEETKKERKPRAPRKPKDTDPVAKITLLDNKLQFNNAAVELTGFEPEQKILVQFEKQGRKTTPVISANDKGNRLTKTYTVSFRGTQHDTLEEYGTVFELIPHPDHEGMFKLQGDAPEKEDDIIDVPEEITDPETFQDELDDLDSLDMNDISFDFND